jgi:hypothetical protein
VRTQRHEVDATTGGLVEVGVGVGDGDTDLLTAVEPASRMW